jgi:hypothetical protein
MYTNSCSCGNCKICSTRGYLARLMEENRIRREGGELNATLHSNSNEFWAELSTGFKGPVFRSEEALMIWVKSIGWHPQGVLSGSN